MAPTGIPLACQARRDVQIRCPPAAATAVLGRPFVEIEFPAVLSTHMVTEFSEGLSLLLEGPCRPPAGRLVHHRLPGVPREKRPPVLSLPNRALKVFVALGPRDMRKA